MLDKIVAAAWSLLAYPLLWLRRFSYWLAMQTKYNYYLMRKQGTLRYRILRRVRSCFTYVCGDVLIWHGRDCDVSLSIPDEISEQEARLLLLAQSIHPRFAEELMHKASWGSECNPTR